MTAVDESCEKLDSHQHFWSVARGDYPWMSSDDEVLCRDYLPEHLQALMPGARVRQTVIVQAAPTIAESKFMLDIAERVDFVAGVVGWIDMESPHAAGELQELAASHWLKGIRPMIEFIPDADWMLGAAVNEALGAVSESGLCFDAVMRPVHLGRLERVARAHPRLRIVIDHGAKPDIAHGAFSPWDQDIARLARYPNVQCKLSGLLTEAAPGARYETLEPYMQRIVDSFGIERVMWGSDWPVLNVASDYATWAHMCERLLEPIGESARQAIFSRNAREFYRL